MLPSPTAPPVAVMRTIALFWIDLLLYAFLYSPTSGTATPNTSTRSIFIMRDSSQDVFAERQSDRLPRECVAPPAAARQLSGRYREMQWPPCPRRDRLRLHHRH